MVRRVGEELLQAASNLRARLHHELDESDEARSPHQKTSLFQELQKFWL